MRRLRNRARGFRTSGGPVGTPVDGMQFTGVQSYSGAVAPGAVSTARVRFRMDAQPDGTLRLIAGPNTGGGGSGWLVCTQDTISGAVNGQLTVYAFVAGVFSRIARHFFMPSDIGRVFTLHIVANGTDVRVYLDGHLMSMPLAAAGGITAATQVMRIGGGASGANGSTALTVLDVAQGTTPLSAADVLTDVASTTPAFAGQTHRYVAAPGIGATWTDQIGTQHLTRFGAPAPISFVPTYGNHRGSIEVWGDSIAAGALVGGVYGNGWRREFQQLMSSVAGKSITILGRGPSSSSTKDFDYFNSATGGEALNTRLATLAADLALYAPADAATVLAYGINDIVALNRSAAQLQADVTTAVGNIAAARSGKIVVCGMIPRNANTAPQQAQWDAYQAGFASFIATLQATYPNVVGVDWSSVVTNAADTAQLFDGTHPTPATYSLMANIIAPPVAAAM